MKPLVNTSFDLERNLHMDPHSSLFISRVSQAPLSRARGCFYEIEIFKDPFLRKI